jgi:hypothetical protein
VGIRGARRLGSGRTLVLADIDEVKLEREGELLTNDGFNVVLQQLDVSDLSAVAELVSPVERTGPFRSLYSPSYVR